MLGLVFLLSGKKTLESVLLVFTRRHRHLIVDEILLSRRIRAAKTNFHTKFRFKKVSWFCDRGRLNFYVFA